MSLLSRSQRTQEYITQIFSHCCKVFVGICSHENVVESIALVVKPRFIVDWTFVFSRPQSTRRSFLTTAPSRTLPLYLFHRLTRYMAVSLGAYAFTISNDTTFQSLYSVTSIYHSLLPTLLPLQVRMQALKCFSVLAYENTQVSMTLVNGKEILFSSLLFSPYDLYFSTLVYLCFLFPVLVDGELLSQVFVRMMQRDQPIEMQLTAAKW